MKKYILILLSSLSGLICYSQNVAKVENDTLYYNGLKFYKGLSLRTGYGSGADNKFSFIKRISASYDLTNCPAELSKTEGVISRVYMEKEVAKISLKVSVEKFPLSIDAEGAVDKKEILY